MADTNLLEQMLEHLVNEDKEKAEELFHQYVVEKSREIYETLLDEEVEEIDEEDEDDSEEEVEESFEELDYEDLDEEDEEDADMTDNLVGDVENDMDDEESMDMEDDDAEELFQDLENIVDELQAKFNELNNDSEEAPEEDETEESFSFESTEADDELATIKEYVEKVAGGHGAETKGSAESADNKSSVVAGKNDMGGTAVNFTGEGSEKNDGGLADITPKEDNMNQVNTPGSKNATKMNSTSGHGAEKKGSAEQADNKDSLFK